MSYPHPRPQSNIRQSLDHRRRATGLDSVPISVGQALMSTSAVARQRITGWLETKCHFYAAQAPDVRRLTLHSAHAAINDFAHLAANKFPPGTPAGVLFQQLGRAGSQVGLGHEQMNSLLSAVANAVWNEVAALPQIRGNEQQVQTCLLRYLQSLHEAAARSLPHAVSAETRALSLQEDLGPQLKAQVLARHGSTYPTVYLVLHTHQTDPAGNAASTDFAEPILLQAQDHVVALHPDPLASSAYLKTLSGPVIYTPPVRVDHLAYVYEITVLLLRMIDLEMAAPRSPLSCQMQGQSSTRVVVQRSELTKIRASLDLLIGEALPRRIRLAQCLHQVLHGPRTHLQHAKSLEISPGTLRKHLNLLEELLGHDLTFDTDTTVQLLALLPILIGLWELELKER